MPAKGPTAGYEVVSTASCQDFGSFMANPNRYLTSVYGATLAPVVLQLIVHAMFCFIWAIVLVCNGGVVIIGVGYVLATILAIAGTLQSFTHNWHKIWLGVDELFIVITLIVWASGPYQSGFPAGAIILLIIGAVNPIVQLLLVRKLERLIRGPVSGNAPAPQV